MLLEEDIKQLIKLKTESKNLDYKENLNWDKGKKEEKLEIIKDILGMANTQDGGKIVFGIRDTDFEFIGLSQDDFESFDQTKLNDFLENYATPKFSSQIYRHKIDEKNVVVIDVPEFREVPIICKDNAYSFDSGDKQILKKGQVYIRTDKATTETIPSVEEMRELLGRALSKKGDELLQDIERLIKGKPLRVAEDSKEKYSEEIKNADMFLSENLGEEFKKYGYWEICAYPIDYNPTRIPNQKIIKELIEKSEVRLRGWNFPHTDFHGNVSNFSRGRQSYTIWERYREGYQAYKSGLFVWKRVIWEDIEKHGEDNKPMLSFISAIWSITEFFLFFKRYYEEIAGESDLHIELTLNKTKERRLASLDFNVLLPDWYVSKEDPIFIEENIKVVDLRSSYKEIANRVIRQLFLVFNLDDMREDIVDQWQTRLLEKRF